MFHFQLLPSQQLATAATICGILGNIVSFVVFLAPVPTFYRIFRRKSTEEFQPVPYSVALFSCCLLLYYGKLKANDGIMIITINSIGLGIEALYLAIYLKYAPQSARTFTTRLLLSFNLGVYGVIFVITFVPFGGPLRVKIVGWVCAVFSVMVFAAPLSVIRLVLTTKSVEYMPFKLSLSLTICAVVWFFYGILIQDYFIALPNVLGFLFGIIQMVLYIIYRNSPESTSAAPNESITDIELAMANCN